MSSRKVLKKGGTTVANTNAIILYFHLLNSLFQATSMEMKQSKISKPRYYIGSKAITIYDPSWFVTCLANHLFDPIILPLKVDKEGVLMYVLQARDNNSGKALDIQWELPESISNSIKLQAGNKQEGEDELDAVWESNDAESNVYKADVNRCLEFWLNQIQQANTFGEKPEIKFLPQICKLKWPWKSGTNEDYFKKFRASDHTHIVRLGVGYFTSEYGVVGASMQLSSYPGKSLSVLTEARSRKRKKPEPHTEEDVLVHDEQKESI